MGRKITIQSSEEERQVYRNLYLSRTLQEWYEQYLVMYEATHDEVSPVCRDVFVTNECADKEIMKYYLTYNQYKEYEELYDEIFEVKEVING